MHKTTLTRICGPAAFYGPLIVKYNDRGCYLMLSFYCIYLFWYRHFKFVCRWWNWGIQVTLMFVM